MEPAFVLHLPPDTARLAFGPLYDPYDDGYVLRFDVELTDDGLTASTAATIAAFDPMQLDAFLQTLADDWRGWDGIRSWRSMEGELLLDATHDRRRRVSLGVTVQPRQTYTSPSWSARCVFELEPGEQLAALANDIAAMLGPHSTRYGK